MDLHVVTEAVRELRARNERVSVRSVHGVLGRGSFRDLSRLLRNAAEFLSAEEVSELEAEIAVPVGQLEQAKHSLEQAEAVEANATTRTTKYGVPYQP